MPFIRREMWASYDSAWKKQVADSLHKVKSNPYLDTRALLMVK